MIQAVLLIGVESWVMLDRMTRKVESTHVVFLRQIKGKLARWQAGGSMEKPAEKEGDTGSGYAVAGHVQRLSESEGSTVGGPTTTSGGLHTGNQI